MNEEHPLVSVIMPCFNGEKFISEAIESVINQTYKNWELIIIDDSSTDNSKKIIKQYYTADKRIHYIQNKKNKGIPSTRNTGIKISNGEYIAFLDQDDLWMKDKLDLFIREFNRYDIKVGIIFSDIEIVFADNIISRNYKKVNYYKIQKLSKRDFIKELFMRNFIKSPSQVVLSKECFNKLGLLDERLHGGDDYDFWLRAAGEFNFKYLDIPLTKYRFHRENTSKKIRYYLEEDFMTIIMPKIIKKYPFLKGMKNKRFSNLYYIYGVYLSEDAKFREAKKYYIKSLRENHLNWKAWIRLFFAYINYNYKRQ
jgi:glycosyltransferase involved in cell wall biosynthesis